MRIIIFLILLVFCSSIKPAGCDCENNKLSLEQQINMVDKIILVSIDEELDKGMWAGWVVKSWTGRETSIVINSNQNDCDYSFQEGKRYLVFTNDNGKYYSVSKCSRTSLVADAGEDITRLYQLIPCEILKPDETINCGRNLDQV